jgi:hypothetical protein
MVPIIHDDDDNDNDSNCHWSEIVGYLATNAYVE